MGFEKVQSKFFFFILLAILPHTTLWQSCPRSHGPSSILCHLSVSISKSLRSVPPTKTSPLPTKGTSVEDSHLFLQFFCYVLSWPVQSHRHRDYLLLSWSLLLFTCRCEAFFGIVLLKTCHNWHISLLQETCHFLCRVALLQKCLIHTLVHQTLIVRLVAWRAAERGRCSL